MILALVISCCLAFLVYHYNFFGLGSLKEVLREDELSKDHKLPIESVAASYNNLPELKESQRSKSFSIDDIEEVKSVKRTVNDNLKTKDNAFDKEMNNAFGDEDLKPK